MDGWHGWHGSAYRAQLRDRASSPFHRARFGFPLLASVSIAEAAERPGPALPEETPIAAALARVPESERSAPLSGVTARLALRPAQSLEDGIRLLAEAGADTAPVLEEGVTRGLVTSRSILRAYRAAAARIGLRPAVPAE